METKLSLTTKTILTIIAWFTVLSMLAFFSGCTKKAYKYKPGTVKQSDSQHRMAKASNWNYDRKR